jgi:hypothetical protein
VSALIKRMGLSQPMPNEAQSQVHVKGQHATAVVAVGVVILITAIILALWRMSCVLRSPQRSLFTKHSNHSMTPLLTWCAFVTVVSGSSIIYYHEYPAFDNVGLTTLVSLVISVLTCAFTKKSFLAYVLLHIFVLGSWYGTIAEFLTCERGTAAVNILKPCWIIPVCCNTSILLLNLVRIDLAMNIDIVRNKDIVVISACLVLILHCVTQYYDVMMLTNVNEQREMKIYIEDLIIIPILLCVHGLYWVACRYMIKEDNIHDSKEDDEDTQVDGDLDSNSNNKENNKDDNKKNNKNKKKDKQKNKQVESIDPLAMPDDCVEVSIEEAIRLTTPAHLRNRNRKGMSMNMGMGGAVGNADMINTLLNEDSDVDDDGLD